MAIEDQTITIETESGRNISLLVQETTRIELDEDVSGGLVDLIIGQTIEAKFDPDSNNALKLEV